MEKVINEFRVVETDDGYRIEIKGDKKHMKDFMKGFGSHKGKHWRHGRRWAYSWDPFGPDIHPMMWAKMAGCWDHEVEETDEDSETEEF